MFNAKTWSHNGFLHKNGKLNNNLPAHDNNLLYISLVSLYKCTLRNKQVGEKTKKENNTCFIILV